MARALASRPAPRQNAAVPTRLDVAVLNRRTITMILTSLFAAGSLLWMQRKFEAGDERNSLAVVQSYRAKHASIPEVLAARHPGRPIEWTTATESACFQHVRVHAVIEEPGLAPVLYAFTVDINGPVIHPANEPGREVLAALDAPLPAKPVPTGSGAAPASSPEATPPAASSPSAGSSSPPSSPAAPSAEGARAP